MRAVFAGLAVGILFSFASFAAPAGTELTADQLKSTIVGRTAAWRVMDSPYSATGSSTFHDDGSLTGQWTTGKYSGEVGPAKWALEGNKVCITDSPANGGKRNCRTWRKMADGTYTEVNQDGTVHTQITIK